MTDKKNMAPKQRILDAAISLFAQKGYAGVGVREIASAAGVNLAMISYYFEGKVGILKAIVEEFFDRYSELFRDVDDESLTPEKCVRNLIQNIINFVRENTELALVTYNELPLDVPEIAELKAGRIMALMRRISGLIRRFGVDPPDTYLMGMVGPSLMAIIFTNFRMRPVLKHVLEVEFDNTYYERFTETITTLFLDGIHGIIARRQKEKGGLSDEQAG